MTCGLIGLAGQGVDAVAAQFVAEGLGFGTAEAAALDTVNGLAVAAFAAGYTGVYTEHGEFGALGVGSFRVVVGTHLYDVATVAAAVRFGIALGTLFGSFSLGFACRFCFGFTPLAAGLLTGTLHIAAFQNLFRRGLGFRFGLALRLARFGLYGFVFLRGLVFCALRRGAGLLRHGGGYRRFVGDVAGRQGIVAAVGTGGGGVAGALFGLVSLARREDFGLDFGFRRFGLFDAGGRVVKEVQNHADDEGGKQEAEYKAGKTFTVGFVLHGGNGLLKRCRILSKPFAAAEAFYMFFQADGRFQVAWGDTGEGYLKIRFFKE